MNVPLLDLKAQYRTIKDEALKTAEEIFESQYFILGPHVANLEARIAEYCRTPFACGVSSGTDALLISLMAAEIGEKDRVITTPYTFFATAGAISRTGARPVFADIDPETYNISPAHVQNVLDDMSAEERARVKAIIPVHLYGQCADMDPLLEIAEKYSLTVIEDAAQAIGAEYKGRRAGSMGDFGCFSFFPSKNLGAFGDGGVVTACSESMDQRLKTLRVHGSHPKYYHSLIGGNFRLDELQAAMVAIKLKRLDQWTEARAANAAHYRALFKSRGLDGVIRTPVEKESRHIYNQFVIRTPDRRDGLRDFLLKEEIGNEIYYPVPLHLQECFRFLEYQKGDFPESERAADQTLALPIYPELSREAREYIVDKIKAFYQ
ncbi:Pleiotropic regulatory protein [Candidatus Desulfarcum epimagneticum]|uniref:Pleiotropic regulatory protein n=1 Tax=uncultured Desulfobacteraceae bacterium TaxID=218296 RepID=A0A484HKX3_9BACT|nr:Pleiotropic regulatory protein [uncultured Desulfobacteraceae bacterium]